MCCASCPSLFSSCLVKQTDAEICVDQSALLQLLIHFIRVHITRERESAEALTTRRAALAPCCGHFVLLLSAGGTSSCRCSLTLQAGEHHNE